MNLAHSGGVAADPVPTRHIYFADHPVAYTLRRSHRRSIGFTVGPEGLRVAAPRWTGIGEIEAALAAKAAWIVRNLAEQRERAGRLEASRIDWRDGATLPYLGETLRITFDVAAKRATLDAKPDTVPVAGSVAAATAPPCTLRLPLPADAAPAAIRDATHRWLLAEARRIFAERAAHFAALLGVRPSRLALSSARTRWGSASARGAVRLNWRLVHFGLPTIDYVVAHELAHLRHMNHGAAFWALVATVIPDVAAQRRTLRLSGVPAFDWPADATEPMPAQQAMR